MSRIVYARNHNPRSERANVVSAFDRPRTLPTQRSKHRKKTANVGNAERLASVAAGAALAVFGVTRKSGPGLLLAGAGAGLVARGISGYCGVYDKLGIDTTERSASKRLRGPHPARQGIHVVESILINKPVGELYEFWRNFENLPRIMSHLEEVRMLGERQSHWIVAAPRLIGGQVEWDAELIRDEPNARIAWRSLPGSQIDQRGMVSFLPAAGDRGVIVRVDVEYRPPAGLIGHWVSKLLGDDPAQQIRDDLRRLKQTLEIGEAITVDGQSQGSCLGRSARHR